jgi:hypothetical protein
MTAAGCTSDLPPAAGPGSPTAFLEDGRTELRLLPRERELVAGGERIPVGIGPTDVVGDRKNYAYVTDAVGNAVLVVRLRPRLEITRRVHVPGSPYRIELDRARRRLLVTTRTRGVVELTADARPRAL